MRPPGYEPGELPTAPPRDVNDANVSEWFLFCIAGAKVAHFSDISKRKGDFLHKKLWVWSFFRYFASAMPPKSLLYMYNHRHLFFIFFLCAAVSVLCCHGQVHKGRASAKVKAKASPNIATLYPSHSSMKAMDE